MSDVDEGFFLRFSAPDMDALRQDIARAELRLAQAQARAEADLFKAIDPAGDLGSMLTTDRQDQAARALLGEFLPAARQHPAHEPSACLPSWRPGSRQMLAGSSDRQKVLSAARR